MGSSFPPPIPLPDFKLERLPVMELVDSVELAELRGYAAAVHGWTQTKNPYAFRPERDQWQAEKSAAWRKGYEAALKWRSRVAP